MAIQKAYLNYKNMSKRILWVDVVKGLLMLAVILGHAIQEPLKVRDIEFENNIWRNIIYSFHMPAFMAMSGYLMYRPNSSGGKYLSSIYKRFKQLIIPFFLWSIPLFFVYHNVDNIWDYILLPKYGYWFLWALFFINVIYTLIDWVCKKKQINKELMIGITALGLIGCQFILPNAKLFGYEYVAFYFIFYMMGYYANKYKESLPHKGSILWLLFIIWAIMSLFWTPNGVPFFLKDIPFVPTKIVQMGYRILTPIIFIIWMYAAATKLKVSDSWIWKILIELGQISLGLYTVHMVVKNLFAKILLDVIPAWPIWIHTVIEFVVLTVFSFFIVRLLLRWRVTSKWLLGKV